MIQSKTMIREAVVLAAGLGTRMRPLTLTRPKPLVEVYSKTLLDHAIDALDKAGVTDVVTNVHYLPDQIIQHVATRQQPSIRISDERDALLDSGGGVRKAIQHFIGDSFFILNADSFWQDIDDSNLSKMAACWNSEKMDLLLLVCRAEQATGFEGLGDFFMAADNQLTRRGSAPSAPYIYAGAILAKPQLFHSQADTVFSVNRLFDTAISNNRLYGCELDGIWLHVGTPDAIVQAEAALLKFEQERQPAG